MRSDYTHNNNPNLPGTSILTLYVKPMVLSHAAGIDPALTDTHTANMAKVFASEALRFYGKCDLYRDFLHHLLRYLTQFLDKGYPRATVLTGLLAVFRKDCHECTKYGNSHIGWFNDINYHLRRRASLYDTRTSNSNTTTHTCTHNTPRGLTCPTLHQLPPPTPHTTHTHTHKRKLGHYNHPHYLPAQARRRVPASPLPARHTPTKRTRDPIV